MEAGLFSKMGISADIVIIALILLVIILCVLVITISLKLSRLEHSYGDFMKGKNAKSLEDTVTSAYRQIDELTENDKEREEENARVIRGMTNTFQKVGIVKYDAFKEMGGKLSFALAILDAKDSGFILNVMHSREACYTYIKEIIKGESYIALGDEEKEALDKAMFDESL